MIELIDVKESQNKIIELEFLDWIHPLMGVVTLKKDDGTPVILRVKIKEIVND